MPCVLCLLALASAAVPPQDERQFRGALALTPAGAWTTAAPTGSFFEAVAPTRATKDRLARELGSALPSHRRSSAVERSRDCGGTFGCCDSDPGLERMDRLGSNCPPGVRCAAAACGPGYVLKPNHAALFCAGTSCTTMLDQGLCCLKLADASTHQSWLSLPGRTCAGAPAPRASVPKGCNGYFAGHTQQVRGTTAASGENMQNASHVYVARSCGLNGTDACTCQEACAHYTAAPGCPEDTCDVAVQTPDGWCNFYTSAGCDEVAGGESATLWRRNREGAVAKLRTDFEASGFTDGSLAQFSSSSGHGVWSFWAAKAPEPGTAEAQLRFLEQPYRENNVTVRNGNVFALSDATAFPAVGLPDPGQAAASVVNASHPGTADVFAIPVHAGAGDFSSVHLRFRPNGAEGYEVKGVVQVIGTVCGGVQATMYLGGALKGQRNLKDEELFVFGAFGSSGEDVHVYVSPGSAASAECDQAQVGMVVCSPTCDIAHMLMIDAGSTAGAHR